MKSLKFSFAAAALAAVFALSGCNGFDTDYKGDSVRAETEHNFLGIIKTTSGSYGYVDEASTIMLNTDELWCRRDFTGAKVTLFWGAITICDY